MTLADSLPVFAKPDGKQELTTEPQFCIIIPGYQLLYLNGSKVHNDSQSGGCVKIDAMATVVVTIGDEPICIVVEGAVAMAQNMQISSKTKKRRFNDFNARSQSLKLLESDGDRPCRWAAIPGRDISMLISSLIVWFTSN